MVKRPITRYADRTAGEARDALELVRKSDLVEDWGAEREYVAENWGNLTHAFSESQYFSDIS